MENDCCKTNNTNKDRGVLKGILYGIIPHIFCIGFIVFSIIGAVSATAILKKFMMIPYFFYILFLLSFIMATVSAFLYLKKNGKASKQGIKNKWKYLVILYGVTILTNFFMFSYVLPALANINSANTNYNREQLSELSIKVQIPCSGHAPLIISELKKDSGIITVNFTTPDIFKIGYNPKQTSPDKIIAMEIFKTYKAAIN
jgi:hypothetical protein